MRVHQSFQYGAATITVSVDDPSKVGRPEVWPKILPAVTRLAGLLEDACTDDELIAPDDKVLDVIRPKKDAK